MLFNLKQKLKTFKETSFFKGIAKGWSIDLLPPKIALLYRGFYNRIFRVVGGIFTLLTLYQFKFGIVYIDYFILYFSLVFLLQLIIIYLIRLVYGLYLILFKPEIFEVRNSR